MKLFNKKNKYVFAGTGISIRENSQEAAKEAVSLAIENLKKNNPKKEPDFGIIFCSGAKYGKDDKTANQFAKGADSEFRKNNPKCEWIGCTTAGEISNYGITDNSCVAMVISSEYFHVGIGVGEKVSKKPQNAAKNAIKNALKDLKMDKYVSPYIQFMARKNKKAEEIMKMNPFSVLLLTPGAAGSYPGQDSQIIQTISDIIGSHVPIVGGAAGDDFMFRQTYQFANGKAYKDAAVLASFSLDLQTRFGVAHGLVHTDKVAMVTESNGKLVTKLNERPAADVYMELTGYKYDEIKGQKAAWAGTNAPFAIVDNEGKRWIKSPQMELNKGLMFFSDIPVNTVLVLMKPDDKKTLNAGQRTVLGSKGKGKFGSLLFFDCGGRKTYLKDKLKKEFKDISSASAGSPFIGFYTYGEFGYSLKTTTNVVNDSLVSFVIEDKLVNEK